MTAHPHAPFFAYAAAGIAGFGLLMETAFAEPVQTPRVWMTPAGSETGPLTLHWQGDDQKHGLVRFGPKDGPLKEITAQDDGTGIRRATLPVDSAMDAEWYYQVGDGPLRPLQGWSTRSLRIAVVADWHGNAKPGSEAILNDAPHLLITAGDNVTSLHQAGKEGIKAYEALIDSARELFARIPVRPLLGNHDKEARPRGSEKPADPVYDITAQAFLTFFGLPEDGWRWHFTFPDHDLSLTGLDLHHLSDFGTTWQSSHAFDGNSAQLRWLRDTAADDSSRFRLFVYNEKNSTVRNLSGGAFGEVFRQTPGSLIITGFGGFTERAEWEGIPSYNTHIHGKGKDYADALREFSTPKGAYLLITRQTGEDFLVVQVKNHSGEVLDTRRVTAAAASH